MKAFDQRQMHYLYEVVQTGSVRAAAEKLDVNPSSVSRSIAELEFQLDMQLLVRHGRGSQITEAGAALVDHYHSDMRRQEQLLAKLEAMRAFQEGQIGIAMGESFVPPFMDHVWSDFSRSFPGISLRLQSGGTNEIVRLVVEDEVQIGVVMNPPRNPRIRSVAILRRPILLVGSADSPLAQLNRPLTMRDIADVPLAVKFGTHGIRQAIDRAADEEKVKLNITMRTSSSIAIHRFVVNGLGMAFMTAKDRDNISGYSSLRLFDIDMPALVGSEMHVIVRSSGSMPEASKHLTKLVTNYMRRNNAN